MKRIYTSIFTLLLLTVALGTGVYAWFTVNTKASATGLTGTAQAADGGFYISLDHKDGDGWKTTLPIGTKSLLNNRFMDLTTGTDGKLVKIALNGDQEIEAEANRDYIEFPIHFISGAEKTEINLNKLEIINNTPETSWVSEKTVGVVSENVIMKAKLSDAMRVGFTETDKPENIFELAGTPVNNYADAINISTGIATFSNTVGLGGFAREYFEAIVGNLPDTLSRVDKVLDATNGHIATTSNVNFPSDINLGDIGDTFTHYAKVVVRVWLEGWDGEAFNAIGSGQITINLDFVIK